MRRVATIKKDIETYEMLLSAESLMDDEKEFLENELKDFREELKKAEAEEGSKPAAKEAPTKKATTKKPAAKKKEPAEKEKSYIIFEGKKIYEDDANYCEKLVEAWRSRKEKAKKAAGKRKTKPVVQRVTKDIADAATKAVQTITKTEIKDDPKGAVKKIERVQKAAQEFLDALEDVMDDEVTKAQFREEFEGFDKLVDEIKKYIKKKDNSEVKSKADENKGHYAHDVGDSILVDSNFVNFSKGHLPNSELKHYGYGDFYLDTPEGKINFNRIDKKVDGFVGRTHRMVGNQNIQNELVAKMKAKDVAVLVKPKSEGKQEPKKKEYNESDYTFFEDAGHGWLEVPKKELKELGIENEISSFSYVKGDKVYLEKDADATTYINALREKGYTINAQNYKTDNSHDNSPIRNYARYEAPNKMADGGEVRRMNLHDAVIYKDKTHYITEKNGQIGLVNMSQGAWGSDYPFTPLTKIIQDEELTDMSGNKVFIPYSFEEGGETYGGIKPYNSQYSMKKFNPKPLLNVGDTFKYKVDGKKEQEYKVIERELEDSGWYYTIKVPRKGMYLLPQSSIFPELDKNAESEKYGFLGRIKDIGDGRYIAYYKSYGSFSGNIFKSRKEALSYLEEIYEESMREPLYKLWKNHSTITVDNKIKTDNQFDLDKMVSYAFEQYPNYNMPKHKVEEFAKDWVKNPEYDWMKRYAEGGETLILKEKPSLSDLMDYVVSLNSNMYNLSGDTPKSVQNQLKYVDGFAPYYDRNQLYIITKDNIVYVDDVDEKSMNEFVSELKPLFEYAQGGEIEMVHLSPENRPNGFTTDKAFKQGDIMVQRVGGSTSWSVAINGVAKGRVLDAYTKEQALRKAEKEYDSSTYADGGFVEGGAYDLGMREKSSMFRYLDEAEWTLESFMSKFSKTEEQADDIIRSWAISRGFNTEQTERLHELSKTFYADGGEIMQHIDERLEREGDIMNPQKKKRLTEIRSKLLHKEKLTEKDTNVLKNEFNYLFADGGSTYKGYRRSYPTGLRRGSTETRKLSKERLMEKLERSYPDINIMETEDGVKIYADFPEDKTGMLIADYWAEDSDYELGIKNHFTNFLNRNGWWAEWQNPEVINLYPNF